MVNSEGVGRKCGASVVLRDGPSVLLGANGTETDSVISSVRPEEPPWAASRRANDARYGGDPSPYSAACASGSATGVRMVTNSSAAVGWMPMVASKACLVAPALSAMPIP